MRRLTKADLISSFTLAFKAFAVMVTLGLIYSSPPIFEWFGHSRLLNAAQAVEAVVAVTIIAFLAEIAKRAFADRS